MVTTLGEMSSTGGGGGEPHEITLKQLNTDAVKTSKLWTETVAETSKNSQV